MCGRCNTTHTLLYNKGHNKMLLSTMVYVVCLVLTGFVCSAVFGVLYRARGGGWNWVPGTFIARLLWSVPIGILFFMTTMTPILGLLSFIGAFAGMWIPHGRVYDLGNVSGNNVKENIYMFVIGVLRAALILIPVIVLTGVGVFYGALLVLIAGFNHLVSYQLGWYYPTLTGKLNTTFLKFDGETSVAEFIYGLLMGIVFFITSVIVFTH